MNNIDKLIQTMAELKTEKEMKEFLKAILTPKELLELPMRLEIVKMLKAGISQHAIAETLGVGIATVTRGSKELQKGHFQNI